MNKLESKTKEIAQSGLMIELDIPRVSHQRQLPNAVKRKLEQIATSLLGDKKMVNTA